MGRICQGHSRAERAPADYQDDCQSEGSTSVNPYRAQSHEEIAKWLGAGAERSRELEREALARLRSFEATSTCAA